MRLREVRWPGSSFNCQGQNLNSGLLTSSLLSIHCLPAASWAPFLGHSSKTSQLPAIWGGKVFSGNRLTHWGWLFSLVHLTRSSPSISVSFCVVTDQRHSGPIWIHFVTLGESFSSLGFSFHCKISILEFSGTQICWCFSHPESILKGNNPIKAYFTYHKIYPFQVYNSMIFSKFTHLCNHHHKSVLEHFYHSNKILCVCACSVVSDSLWPTRLLCPWNFPGKGTGVSCHFLLQGIFPTQGSNPVSCSSCFGRRVLYHWATCPS